VKVILRKVVANATDKRLYLEKTMWQEIHKNSVVQEVDPYYAPQVAYRVAISDTKFSA